MVKKELEKAKKIIRHFTEELKKEIPIEKILLFGSYANGHPGKDSDIDVIVVSKVFAKGKHMAHMQYLFRKAARINSLLEPFPAAPSEIKKPDPRIFPGQIIKTALVFKY